MNMSDDVTWRHKGWFKAFKGSFHGDNEAAQRLIATGLISEEFSAKVAYDRSVSSASGNARASPFSPHRTVGDPISVW